MRTFAALEPVQKVVDIVYEIGHKKEMLAVVTRRPDICSKAIRCVVVKLMVIKVLVKSLMCPLHEIGPKKKRRCSRS